MSYLIAVPDVVQGAAQDLAGIRASLTEAAATAGPTTGIAASAADEVSVAIASLFDSAGRQFQTLNAQAQAFHAEFESLLGAGAAAYVSAEAANAGQVLGNAVAGGGQAVPAAAVPAATYRTFNLFNGALDINIGTGGIQFTISTPGVILPAVHVPPINVAAFNLPQLTIPPINIPAGSTVANVTVSPFSLPQLSIPSISIPAGTTPATITVGAFDLPQITTPAITVPPINLPAVTIPAFQTPLIQVTGWSLPSITVPQINLPQIQIPDINVPGGGQTVVHLHTGNVLFPDYDINLQSFDFAPSLGFNTPGFITPFVIPSIQIGALTLPFLNISNPSGGSYVFPSIGLSGFSIPSVTVPPIAVGGFTLPQVSWPAFTTAPLTIPPIGVGGFTLPQVSWPGFATAPLTIPPIGVGGFSLPDVNVPQITLAPVQQEQFLIPPIPTWLNGATVIANDFVGIVEDVAASLLGVGP
ncbi:PE family protein [Mycobacterium sp. 852002-50816_SCH5313054-b]|uniref:PE family protein n=1 Tax=Mycobacterium sp. 852002-50816_SCH5313054-b TaxID=1834092 RepID=UPI000A7F908F|nr:PE family protein [Mycobacterium sp. 852002-50816_SCH5313054-b]